MTDAMLAVQTVRTILDESDPNGYPAPPHDALVRLAAIAEVSNDAVIGKDMSGRVTSWNKAAEAMFGYTAAEMVGESIIKIVPADKMDERTSTLRRIYKGEETIKITTRRLNKNGNTVPVSITASSIRDSQGTIIGATHVVRDLTELQRLNHDLERREALLSSILDTVPDPMIVIDQSGTVQSFSATAEELFGYSLKEIMGQKVSMLMPSPARRHLDDYLANYRSTGQRSVFGVDRTVLGQRKDGSTFPLELTIGEVNLPTGRFLIGFVHNMTDRDERESKLRNALEAAERANRAKSHFLAGMSHELRTPLNGILGYARLLRMEGGLTSAQDARVSSMLAAGEHLLQMVACVLDLSEIEADHVELKPVEFDVRAVATACLDLVRPSAEAKSLSLSVVVAPGTRQKLVADLTRLRQIVLNLLGNAVKFTPQGEIELRLRSVMRGTVLRVEVTDTGPGITVEDRQRLFRSFERLDPTSAVEGAGLGLVLSARLAALMGGRLGHDDNPSGGSIFWLELPLNAVATPLPLVLPSCDTPTTALRRRRLHVLVADDILMNRDIAGSYLRVGGHTATCVEGGAEAVAAAAVTDFDIILMDVRMPGMDGLEATRRIRALDGARGRVPIVALTAQAFTEQIAECRKAGMDIHLAKPFDLDVLLEIVARACEARVTDGESASPSAAPTILPEAAAVSLPGAELPVFNSTVFDRAASYLSPDAVATYLQTIAEQGKNLLHGLRQKDALKCAENELAEGAHTLAGCAGMFGFERLSMLSRRFERAIQSGTSDAPNLADALSLAIEAALRVIHSHIAQPAEA